MYRVFGNHQLAVLDLDDAKLFKILTVCACIEFIVRLTETLYSPNDITVRTIDSEW